MVMLCGVNYKAERIKRHAGLSGTTEQSKVQLNAFFTGLVRRLIDDRQERLKSDALKENRQPRVRVAAGGHRVHCAQDRLRGSHPAGMGQLCGTEHADRLRRVPQPHHEQDRVEALEREVKALRRANEILKLASALLVNVRWRWFSPRRSSHTAHASSLIDLLDSFSERDWFVFPMERLSSSRTSRCRYFVQAHPTARLP